jgi:hypothetical protein
MDQMKEEERMPALKDLEDRINRDPEWTRMFRENWQWAAAVAREMPLLHVTGKHDGFEERLLAPPYQLTPSGAGASSESTLAAEESLDLGSSLYFYAGRAHPGFGLMALAFKAESESSHTGSATPFDSGGVCRGYIRLALSQAGQEALRRFVRESIVDLSRWRDEFAKFLAAYFSPLLAYWSDRPCRSDPEQIFADPQNEWRAWTYEVRFREVQQIFDAVAWCAKGKDVRERFNRKLRNVPALRTELREAIAHFRQREIRHDDTVCHCELIQEWARKEIERISDGRIH